jgi:hypothetical protein
MVDLGGKDVQRQYRQGAGPDEHDAAERPEPGTGIGLWSRGEQGGCGVRRHGCVLRSIDGASC